MSGGSNFNWKQADKKNLERAVSNYNAKRERLQRKYGEWVELPPKLTIREVKKKINSRRELNKQIANLKKFSKKGGENKYLGLFTPSKKQMNDLRSAVRAFNTARTKEARLHPETAQHLPEKRSVQEIARNAVDAKDLRKTINELKKGRKPGQLTVVSKGGVLASKWELERQKKLVRTINKARAEQRKRIQKPEETGKVRLAEGEVLTPKSEDFSKMKNLKWDKYIKTLENQARPDYFKKSDQTYKMNYVRAAFNELGDKYGSIIYEAIKDINPTTFVDWLYNDANLDIDFFYGAEKVNQKAETIFEALQSHGVIISLGTKIRTYNEVFPMDDLEKRAKLLKKGR